MMPTLPEVKIAFGTGAFSLLGARELTFEDEPAVEEALFYWKDSACGFADCLITAHNRQLGCRATATFDAKAARLPGALQL